MHRNDPDGLGYRFLRQNAAASQCSPHPRGAAAGRVARMRLLSVLPAPARCRLRESTTRSTAGCATRTREVQAERGKRGKKKAGAQESHRPVYYDPRRTAKSTRTGRDDTAQTQGLAVFRRDNTPVISRDHTDGHQPNEGGSCASSRKCSVVGDRQRGAGADRCPQHHSHIKPTGCTKLPL